MLKYIIIASLVLAHNALGQDALSAVLEGLEKHDVTAVRTLIQRGVSPDSADRQGNTLLQIAARSGDLEMVRVLLQAKAKSELRNALGETALMLAAVGGHLEVVRELVQAGSLVNATDGSWGPLHYAAWRGHLNVCQFLLERGADIDARGVNGITPVMMAVRSGDFETVRYLVWEVANLDLESVDGSTALSWAQRFDLKEIAAHLKAAGAKR